MSQYPLKRNDREQLALTIASKLKSFHAPLSNVQIGKQSITVVCISDTHSKIAELPPGDLLLHSGDLTEHGIFDELQAQLNWLDEQPHEHKIVIGGNHDLILDDALSQRDASSSLVGRGKSKLELQWGSIIYLQESTVRLEFSNGRKLTVYGTPFTPKFGNFAFQYPRTNAEEYWANRIPDDADIVMTHGPPRFHLDQNDYGGSVGCEGLLKELYRAKPKLVVCGHIHESAGQEVLTYDLAQQGWEAAIRNQSRFSDLPGMLWSSMFRGTGSKHNTLLVNAAMMKGFKGNELRAAAVITL